MSTSVETPYISQGMENKCFVVFERIVYRKHYTYPVALTFVLIAAMEIVKSELCKNKMGSEP